MGFQIAAAVLLTAFYGMYFYKQLNLRTKGIRTNRMAKGSKPPKTAAIERFLKAATYLTAAGQYASVCWGQHLLPVALPDFLRITGLAIALCGVVFFVLATTHMKDSWRAGIDESQSTAMVTNGVYRISRNPAFVGFDFLYIGIALAIPNVVLFALMVVTVCLLHLQILEEEAYLPKVFRDAYLKYKAETPRYLLF